MKRLIPIVVLMSALAFGQAARYDSTGQTVVSLTGVSLLAPAPNASITVCAYPAVGGVASGSGGPCTNKAAVCPDSTATSCTTGAPNNPATADSLGNFGFWISPGIYQYTICPQSGVCRGPYNAWIPFGADTSGIIFTSLTSQPNTWTAEQTISGLNGSKNITSNATDFGTQFNAIVSGWSAPMGSLHLARNSSAYAFSVTASADDKSGLMLGGDGGYTGGAAAGSWLNYTTTGTAFSVKSTAGFRASNLFLTWNSTPTAYFDLSHSALANDSDGFEFSNLKFAKTGLGGTAPLLINLDKSNNGSIHHSGFSNFTVAIQGMASNASYANAVSIDHNEFIGGTAVKSPGQAWGMGDNVHEFTSTTGNKMVDCTVGGNSGIGLLIENPWGGDDVTAVDESLIDSCQVVAVLSPYISGVQAYTTFAKVPASGYFSMSGGVFTNIKTIADFTATNARVDVGPHSSTGVTNEYTGTPVGGRWMNPSGVTDYFGLHKMMTGAQWYIDPGSLAAPAIAFRTSTNTGFFFNSNTRVQLAYGGVAGWMADSTGIFMGSGQGYRWGNAADPNAAGSFDTSVSRSAAGVVCADTTTVGNCLGTFKAAVVQAPTILNTGTLTLPTRTGTLGDVIASGTATFTTTAVLAGACQTTVTVAATNALTTDTITWAYATAPTAATDGMLHIQPYVTANNVNFMRCNPTAGSITPTAIVINWKVI